MHVLIAYDISDNRTRGKFFKFLREKGLHSQKSVFECDLDQQGIQGVRKFAASLNLQEHDSVAIYPLCARCSRRARILGQGIHLVRTAWTII
ncbi:MAG: CRISPR-associated endonuclease Cas2 [Desulfovibrio sp.]|nr:CRISPR-associated endonuclease Cas2 [Desulfovibrio sp.]